MDAKILAICDMEISYARKLTEVFSEKKDLIFQVHAFSTAEQLKIFSQKTAIEILLISDKQMDEEIRNLNVRKIFLLSADEIPQKDTDDKFICKYQSAEKIMKEVLSCYAEDPKVVSGICNGLNQLEIIGVFSPLGRCGKTCFSVAAGKRYAKDRKTLLLNLESYSAFGGQKEQEESWDLSDLLYFMRQGKKTFLYKLSSIVQHMDELDYVLPMNSPIDIRSITETEWKDLLKQLTDHSLYQVVVIDFGYDVNEIFELLNQCTKIYMPVLPDEISRIKVENFEKILRGNNFESVTDKIVKVCLPESLEKHSMEMFMEKWVKRNVQISEPGR